MFPDSIWPYLLIAAYCLLVALASLAGGVLPLLLRLTHTGLQLIMSFVGGLVLAVALLHLLPHAVIETGSLNLAAWATLVGLLITFFLLRLFHVHQHGPIEAPGDGACHHAESHESCPHHDYPLDGEYCGVHRRRYSWIGLFVGLALHTLLDGVAIAACVTAEARHVSAVSLVGLGTFLAVVLHKPLDAMSITSVMAAGNWSRGARHLANVCFACMAGLGAAGFCLGLERFTEQQHLIIGLALGFSAGVFLCLSLADILPEVHFHSHDRLKLSCALLLGIALAYSLGVLESPHQHGPDEHGEHSHDDGHNHSHDDGHSHSHDDGSSH